MCACQLNSIRSPFAFWLLNLGSILITYSFFFDPCLGGRVNMQRRRQLRRTRVIEHTERACQYVSPKLFWRSGSRHSRWCQQYPPTQPRCPGSCCRCCGQYELGAKVCSSVSLRWSLQIASGRGEAGFHLNERVTAATANPVSFQPILSWHGR